MENGRRVAAVTVGAGVVAAVMVTAAVGPTFLAIVAGIGAAIPVGFVYAVLLLESV